MPRGKRAPAGQASMLEVWAKTAPCVPEIRRAVAEWRERGYKGATETTQLLLNYWFRPEPGSFESTASPTAGR